MEPPEPSDLSVSIAFGEDEDKVIVKQLPGLSLLGASLLVASDPRLTSRHASLTLTPAGAVAVRVVIPSGGDEAAIINDLTKVWIDVRVGFRADMMFPDSLLFRRAEWASIEADHVLGLIGRENEQPARTLSDTEVAAQKIFVATIAAMPMRVSTLIQIARLALAGMVPSSSAQALVAVGKVFAADLGAFRRIRAADDATVEWMQAWGINRTKTMLFITKNHRSISTEVELDEVARNTIRAIVDGDGRASFSAGRDEATNPQRVHILANLLAADRADLALAVDGLFARHGALPVDAIHELSACSSALFDIHRDAVTRLPVPYYAGRSEGPVSERGKQIQELWMRVLGAYATNGVVPMTVRRIFAAPSAWLMDDVASTLTYDLALRGQVATWKETGGDVMLDELKNDETFNGDFSSLPCCEDVDDSSNDDGEGPCLMDRNGVVADQPQSESAMARARMRAERIQGLERLNKLFPDYAHTAKDIAKTLGQRVLGQPAAVRAMALHLHAYRRGQRPGPLLLVGPSGCGKTTLVQSAAEIAGVPALFVDSANLVPVGIVGTNPTDWIHRLITNHYQANRKNAENGGAIVCFDEVDKILCADSSHHSASVKAALLTMLGGGEVPYEVELGTRTRSESFMCGNVLFVLAGAWSALRNEVTQDGVGFALPSDHISPINTAKSRTTLPITSLSLSDELRGRISSYATMEPLNIQGLTQILRSPVGPWRTTSAGLDPAGGAVALPKWAETAIVEAAIKRGVGARGLHQICAKIAGILSWDGRVRVSRKMIEEACDEK